MRTKWIIREILLVEFVFCLAGAVQACVQPPCPPCWGPWPQCNIFCNNEQNKTCCNNSCCTNDCCYGSCFNNATKYCCGPGVLCNNGDGCCDGKACFDDETKHCCNHGTGKTCNIGTSCCKGTQGEACCNDALDETCCDGKCCTSGEVCCEGSCISSCYATWNVPQQDIPCPACSPLIGCDGEATSYLAHSWWRLAQLGEFGHTKNPVKTGEDLIIDFPCENNYSIAPIINCAGQALDCLGDCLDMNWYSCVGCLISNSVECATGGWCTFIESCDPDIEHPRYDSIENIVDWSGDLGCGCIGH